MPQYTCFTHRAKQKFGKPLPLCPNLRETKLLTVNSFYPSRNKHYHCGMMLTANMANIEWILVDCHKELVPQVFCSIPNKEYSQQHMREKEESPGRFSCLPDHILNNKTCYSFHWYIGKNSSEFSLVCHYTGGNPTTTHLQISFLLHYVSQKLLPILHPILIKNSQTTALSTAEGLIGCMTTTKIQHPKFVTFWCGKGGYVSVMNRCDGHVDCPNDASDEAGCDCTKTAKVPFDQKHLCKEFVSPENKKICGHLYFKNLQNVCQKYFTGEWQKQRNWPLDLNNRKTSKCPSGKIIENHKIDDLFGDCEDASDEHTLLSLLTEINDGENWSCSSPELIPCHPRHHRCFKITDLCIYCLDESKDLYPCRNGGHLENCGHFECNAKFKCFKSYCIPWSYVCDGKLDCPHSDDENYKPVCGDQDVCVRMYKCWQSSTCLHLANICDGVTDCPKADDEFVCSLHDSGCLGGCECLALGVLCQRRRIELFPLSHSFSHISVSFVECDFLQIQKLSVKFPNITFLAVIQSSLTSIDVCPLFGYKLGEIDLNGNDMRTITKHCFKNFDILQIIKLDHNKITRIESLSFVNLSSLFLLSLSHNGFTTLFPNFADSKTNIKVLNLLNTAVGSSKVTTLKNLSVMVVLTKESSVCCLASSSSVCLKKIPWYESCGRLLLDKILGSIFAFLSILIGLVNITSIICSLTTRKQNKALSNLCIFINAGDLLCGIYLLIIWIADETFGDSFVLQKQMWTSGFACVVSFGIILWFSIITHLSLFTLAFSRLMLVVFPMDTKFKDAAFVKNLCLSIFVGSFTFSLCVMFCLKLFQNFEIQTDLCLPFVDPTHSTPVAMILTLAVTSSQCFISVAIIVIHIVLVHKVNQSEKNVSKSSSGDESKTFLRFQLIAVTLSSILCWFSTNGVFTAILFLPRFSIKLVVWTTIMGLPLNSLVNPSIFVLNFIRKAHKGN